MAGPYASSCLRAARTPPCRPRAAPSEPSPPAMLPPPQPKAAPSFACSLTQRRAAVRPASPDQTSAPARLFLGRSTKRQSSGINREGRLVMRLPLRPTAACCSAWQTSSIGRPRRMTPEPRLRRHQEGQLTLITAGWNHGWLAAHENFTRSTAGNEPPGFPLTASRQLRWTVRVRISRNFLPE